MSHLDDDAREALLDLVRRRPELLPLVDKLTMEAEIEWGRDFHAAYRESQVEGRSLVRRILFDDVSLLTNRSSPILTRAVARRVRTYLEALPSEPLRTGYALREDISKPLARLFNLGRAGWLEVSNAIVRELWPCGNSGSGVWSQDTCSELWPVVLGRLITESEADRLVTEGLEAPAASYYFVVPDADAIAVRNMVVYLGRLFAHGRNSGREQNLIPLQVSRRFGIRPRSVPETLAVLDALSLLAHGCIRPDAQADPLRIASIFAQPVPGGFDGFWRAAVAPHLARNFITDPNAPVKAGMYDSGFLFNTARLAGLTEGKKRRLEQFAPYYASADLGQLLAVGLQFWGGISQTVVRRCRALAKDLSRTGEPAIRLRDLANIVCLAEAAPDGSTLPSVARFALGEPEPEHTGRLGPLGPRPIERNQVPVRVPTPQLVALVQRLDGLHDSNASVI